jgi:hypothetical protein
MRVKKRYTYTKKAMICVFIHSFIQTTSRNKSAALIVCHIHVCAILMRERERDGEREKKVDDCSNTMLLCVKRTRALCTSSAAASIPFFFPLFCSLAYSPRFSFMCSATHSTVRRVTAKRKRAVTASATAVLAKYLSSHHHHHYYSFIN